jgi:hypothetical protein
VAAASGVAADDVEPTVKLSVGLLDCESFLLAVIHDESLDFRPRHLFAPVSGVGVHAQSARLDGLIHQAERHGLPQAPPGGIGQSQECNCGGQADARNVGPTHGVPESDALAKHHVAEEEHEQRDDKRHGYGEGKDPALSAEGRPENVAPAHRNKLPGHVIICDATKGGVVLRVRVGKSSHGLLLGSGLCVWICLLYNIWLIKTSIIMRVHSILHVTVAV